MPLSDDFLLTQMTIDLVDGPRSRAALTVDPDDVMARGLDATFLNVRQTVDMSDALVNLYWQHDQAPALRGLEPFEAVDATAGRWKVHWPSAMGRSAGTVTAKIMVSEEGRTIAIPLPTIRVPGDRADPSATPSGDTFSVLAELLDVLRGGLVDVTEVTDLARDAAADAEAAARDARDAAEGIGDAARAATEAAGAANAAADAATGAAASATEAATAAGVAASGAEEAAGLAREAAGAADAAAGRADAAATSATDAAASATAAASDATGAAEEARTAADAADAAVEDLGRRVADGEFDGATFTPSVDAEGNLSWTNDRGLEDPATVNVRGPKGDVGERGPKGDVGEGLNILDVYGSLDELVAAHPEGGDPGDGYMVGTHYYIWDGSEWADCGELKGPKGDTGDSAGPLWLEVDAAGDLWAYYDDNWGEPNFDYDAGSGDLYAIFETEA